MATIQRVKNKKGYSYRAGIYKLPEDCKFLGKI